MNERIEKEDKPKNSTPLIYTHFPCKKRDELIEKLSEIYNALGVDNEFGIRDFVLAETTVNFLMVLYNTKAKTEELGYHEVNQQNEIYL